MQQSLHKWCNQIYDDKLYAILTNEYGYDDLSQLKSSNINEINEQLLVEHNINTKDAMRKLKGIESIDYYQAGLSYSWRKQKLKSKPKSKLMHKHRYGVQDKASCKFKIENSKIVRTKICFFCNI